MIFPSPEFLEKLKATNGALSVAESIAVMNIASQVPKHNAIWAEFGVYNGKSAMSAVYGGVAHEFHLVEPEFEKTIPISSVTERISSVTRSKTILIYMIGESVGYLNGTNHNFSYVFVDSGSHQDGLPMAEAKLLEDRMARGGIIAWHDFGNQFREPKEAAEYLVSTGKYEWIDINWQPIFDFVNENDLEKDNQSWHQYPELPHSPNFVGAIKRK